MSTQRDFKLFTVANYKRPKSGTPCLVRCGWCGGKYEGAHDVPVPCPHCEAARRVPYDR